MVLISRGPRCFCGRRGVATMAYVIDVSEPSKRAANLAVYTAMQSVRWRQGICWAVFWERFTFSWFNVRRSDDRLGTARRSLPKIRLSIRRRFARASCR
ncbi:MAG: hypothetical protein ACLVJ6_10065 [Merdibacter sp.]